VSWEICPFARQDRKICRTAAQLLVEEFREHWPDAWPTLEAAEAEVSEALHPEKILCMAIAESGNLLGWIGAQPQYGGRVWELHPLVVEKNAQRNGIGRALVERLEREVRAKGGLTLWAGTDDEAGLTSIGGVDLYPGVLEKLLQVHDWGQHPLGFYRRLGFEVVGVVPDANGLGRPDILVAKRVS
jgi:aminoglycoside 6'-N-acetyltransferase I